MTSSIGPPNGPGMRLSQRDINRLLGELASRSQTGPSRAYAERMAILRQIAQGGGVRTLEMLLPLCLMLRSRPYTLANHFPFSPLFDISMPHNLLLKTGRQVSKSTSLASHGVMLANCIPDFRTLYVTPLYEQIRRFSNNYVRPFIDLSPIKPLWSGTTTENSVLQRSFKNLSMMIFSFALLDADRIRGVAADKVAIDEVQDMDPDHLPIIRETMSASDYKLHQFTGTPKSRDNPIEGLWKRSSQAEWFIRCTHGGCGEWNIPSLEFHVDRMIGPPHEGISERVPGIVCYKCQKPLYPRTGRWVHRYPNRRGLFSGFHVPQIIMPMHYARVDSWRELCAKREGWGNTPLNVFYNEVLGESVDVGQKLVSETELEAACLLDWENNPNSPSRHLQKLLPHYQFRVLAVDWGGGGEDEVSFTTLALLGYRPDGKIDVLWGKRLLTPNDHLREALEIRHWMQAFRCHMLTHDYTGAGIVRETVLIQAGFSEDRIMPIQYVRAASRSLIKCVEPTPLHQRRHWRLDKPRSLLYTCQAIKLRLLRFFKMDYKNDDNAGLIHDFLALVEESTESRLAGKIYTITKNPMLIDDFAQAVNIGCACVWHAHGWPNFAHAANVARITPQMVEAAGSRDWGWEDDRSMSGFFNQP